MRVSYVGELGWELHLASADLATVYHALWEVGSDLGLIDFGSYALNSMRLEKGYHAWGADFGTEYTLFDAGLQGFAKLDKVEFTGRAAVLEQQQQTAEWQFAGFEILEGDADALASDPILLGDECVGYVSSGGYGFRINKRLALGYVRDDINTQSAEFTIKILGKLCQAKVCELPYYKAK